MHQSTTNFKLNAIHGHATWQHHSTSTHMLKKENAIAKSPDSLEDPVYAVHDSVKVK